MEKAAPTSDATVAGSFRDPSGFLFRRDGRLLRQINAVYAADYEHFIQSGLYAALTKAGRLVPHREAPAGEFPGTFRVIEPELIPFVSYPYEWCFSALKAAAMHTLDVQSAALEHGMTLKDASAYNVQFRGTRPVFIDTLSFTRYREGRAWDGYGQFCRHFLAPLALMSTRDVRLGQLARVHLDGVPLDLAARLLPARAKLRPALYMHLVLHARAQARYEGTRPQRSYVVSRRAHLGILDSLRGAVEGLRYPLPQTVWTNYYGETNYSERARAHKEALVNTYLDQVAPASVWDFGSNTGEFARLASARGIYTVCFDSDPAVVESAFRRPGSAPERQLPLVVDLANPSPGLGWAGTERAPLADRGRAGMGFALALVHHIAIAGNVPLERIAAYFRSLCETLVIEFVPKADSQVQRLLASREDIFADYHAPAFEAAFRVHFDLLRADRLDDSERVLYLLRAKP